MNKNYTYTSISQLATYFSNVRVNTNVTVKDKEHPRDFFALNCEKLNLVYRV